MLFFFINTIGTKYDQFIQKLRTTNTNSKKIDGNHPIFLRNQNKKLTKVGKLSYI
jgi:hypothetical protein